MTPVRFSSKLSALRAEVGGVGRLRPHPFHLLRFRRTEKRAKTLQIPGAAILTLPRPREATNRPTRANTGLHLHLRRRPRLLLKLPGEIVQAHTVLLLAERLHLPNQHLLLGGVQVVAPVLL